MNFWPRGPFIPAVAASIPFQAIQPAFNNPAWDIPQQVVTGPFFAQAVAAVNPWASSNDAQAGHSRDKSDKEGEGSSPWFNDREDNKEGRSRHNNDRTKREERDRSRDRDKSRRRRSRSRSRSREHRSLESDSPRDRRGRERSRERRDTRRERDEDRRDIRDSERRRDRSPGDRKDDGRRRSRDDEDINETPLKRIRQAGDDKYSLEAANYRTQTPNETIMIRGLAQHITENDIRTDIVKCGLRPKDIRLIRKKETGVSRGFAFVEFNNTEEALCWMELKQGVLMVQDLYRAVMQFSIVAGDVMNTSAPFPPADWDCPKCYAHNFKKRVTCYKCLQARPDSDPKHPNSEISPHPTTKIMIRNLDPLTTEEDLLKEVSAVSDISIQSCQISRDTLANLSRGVCYLEMKNVLEAIKLYNEITAQPLLIQGRKVVICYCKLQVDTPAAEWPADQIAQTYSMSDIPKLAEYSARMYSTNPAQKATLIQYYTQYYTDQIKQIEGPKDANSAAAVALSAMQMAQTKKAVLAGAAASALSAAAALNNTTAQPSTANAARAHLTYGYLSSQQLIGNTSVGEPDMNSYAYEESSGYYFDQKTGLYYDPNTQYYYHGQDQVYLYWDAEKKAYMLASDYVSKTDESREEKKNKKEDKEKEKQQDKVKVAKRIAKDMERWAKTLNQKKEGARQTQVQVQQTQYTTRTAATADIAFDVLERQEAGSLDFSRTAAPEDQGALVASYGGGSDSDEGAEEPVSHEHFHTDWVKMACLLCKRQFPSKEGLQRHNELSDLHKQNINMWYSSRGIEQPPERGSDAANLSYRDRAQERRKKFGMPDAPKPSKIKEKFMKTQIEQPVYEEPTRTGIPSGNLGSKMLQKMGWSEGMGLGKMNQGRTDIVHAVQRVSTAGLGVAGSTLGSGPPGNSYKENVKRAAMARFSEMQEREQS